MEAEILSTWSLEETAAFFHSMEPHVRKDFYAQQHIPAIAQVGPGRRARPSILHRAVCRLTSSFGRLPEAVCC